MKPKTIITLVIISIIAAGGFCLGNDYFKEKFGSLKGKIPVQWAEDINKAENENIQVDQAAGTETDRGIIINEKIEGIFKQRPYQPGDFYYYEINKDVKIVFIRREAAGGSFPNGDVILEKNGEEFILLSDVELFGPGGEAFEVWNTNNSDIFLLRFVSGDMGWWQINEYYLDLAKNKVVFEIKDDQGYNLEIKKETLNLKLGLNVIDQCGKFQERTNKTAQIVDLLLNNQTANVLTKTIDISCVDPGGIGSIYDPDFYLIKRKIESDFSKLEFSLVGVRFEDGVEKEIWREEFYISLADIDNIKIYRK